MPTRATDARSGRLMVPVPVSSDRVAGAAKPKAIASVGMLVLPVVGVPALPVPAALIVVLIVRAVWLKPVGLVVRFWNTELFDQGPE